MAVLFHSGVLTIRDLLTGFFVNKTLKLKHTACHWIKNTYTYTWTVVTTVGTVVTAFTTYVQTSIDPSPKHALNKNWNILFENNKYMMALWS